MSGSASSSDIVQLILINLNLDQPEQLESFLERIEVLSCCLVGSDNDKQSGLIGNKLGFWIRQLHVGTSTRSPIPQSPTATEGVDGQDPRATSCRLHTDGYPNLSATIVLKKLGIKHTKEWPNLSPIDLCHHKRRAKADNWKDVGAAEKRRNARDKRADNYHNVIPFIDMQQHGSNIHQAYQIAGPKAAELWHDVFDCGSGFGELKWRP